MIGNIVCYFPCSEHMFQVFSGLFFTVLIGLGILIESQIFVVITFRSYNHLIFSGWLVGLVWFGMWTLFTFSKYAVGNELPVFWEWKGRFILSFISSDIFKMSIHNQVDKIILYWTILRSFTLFGLI